MKLFKALTAGLLVTVFTLGLAGCNLDIKPPADEFEEFGGDQ